MNIYLDLVPDVNAKNILNYLDSLYDFSKEEKYIILRNLLDSDKLIKDYLESKNKKNKSNKI